MTTQHTPGPWTVFNEFRIKGKSKVIHISICDTLYVIIATLEELPGEDWSMDEVNANARLIAATPEMLETLNYYVKLFKNGDSEWIAYGDKAREAIAKATGENH